MTTTQIGKTVGLTKSSVGKRIKKLGLVLRKSSDYSGQKRYWRWKGDDYISPIARKRNQSLHRKWSNLVQTRDKFICQDCGAKEIRLHAHHLISLRECLNTQLEYEVTNGITLCVPCHGARHKEINRKRESKQ
jgi:5-methylcytosine-specific restriction endonuclease McrA